MKKCIIIGNSPIALEQDPGQQPPDQPIYIHGFDFLGPFLNTSHNGSEECDFVNKIIESDDIINLTGGLIE